MLGCRRHHRLLRGTARQPEGEGAVESRHVYVLLPTCVGVALERPVLGLGLDGKVAWRVVLWVVVAVGDILAVPFANLSCLLHLSPGCVALGTLLELLWLGVVLRLSLLPTGGVLLRVGTSRHFEVSEPIRLGGHFRGRQFVHNMNKGLTDKGQGVPRLRNRVLLGWSNLHTAYPLVEVFLLFHRCPEAGCR